MKRQPTDWEKILVNNAMGKGLICKIEKVKKYIYKQQQQQKKTIKNGQKT